ncbi:MAG: DUF2784 family protein [Pseudomonadota bacterium]
MDGALLGQVILAIHLVVIAFNVIGLAVIPLGGVLGWTWVRLRWLRLLHLASLAVVAVQAALGEACFLTIWQAMATGEAPEPLITRWVNSLIYWPLPMWIFTTAYIAVFLYVLALWWLVPPRRRQG